MMLSYDVVFSSPSKGITYLRLGTRKSLLKSITLSTLRYTLNTFEQTAYQPNKEYSS